MSSAGINPYLDPEDYNKQQAIKRRQILAQSLLEQGQSDPGSQAYGGLRTAGNAILGAFLSRRADKDMAASNPSAGLGQNLSSSDPAVRQKAYQTALLLGVDPKPFQEQQAQAAQPRLLQNMQPQFNPVQSTPMVSPQNPVNSPMRQMAQNAPNESAPSMQDALIATNSPELSAQLAPQLLQQQMLHQQKVQDNTRTMLTPKEITDAGFRPGTVATKDPYGNISVEQQSDLKSPEAIQQGQDVLRTQPMTPEQIATNKRADATAAEARRHNFAEESAAANKGIVDPKAIELGVNYFMANGGKLPPTARSPALQQGIMSAAQDRLQASGQTMDDLVSKGIGLHAQQGAATGMAKTQAQTAVNEGTVNNSIDIVRKLLPTAASKGQFTDVNNLTQNLSRRTNDPQAVLLKNGIDSISAEYARVMTGATTGSPSSDASRKEAAQRILYGYNAGTIDQVLGQMQQEMAGRSNSQASVLRNLTGGKYQGAQVPGAAPIQAAPTATDALLKKYGIH